MKNTILKSIILSLVLIAGANTAWAASFSGAGVKYYVNTHIEDQWWNLENGSINLGTISKFYLKGYWAELNGEGNVCQNTRMYYRIYGKTSLAGNIVDPNNNWNRPVHFQREDLDVNVLEGLEAGDYTLEIWFSNGEGESSCNIWHSNGGANYKMSFTYVSSYLVTLKADSHGTYSVTCNGKTINSKLDEDAYIDVPVDSPIRISTHTQNTGYAQTNGAAIQYDGGNRVAAKLNTDITITGNATITGNFVSKNQQEVYLQPTSEWDVDKVDEVYRAYVYHDTGNAWVNDAEEIKDNFGSTNEYKFIIPAGYHSIIFCRVNSKGTDNDPWKNVWNQTNDLLIPVGQSQNCYKITEMGITQQGNSKPDNCLGVWKLRTFNVKVYAAGFGEYGFVYDNVKHFSKADEDLVYEVPQGATIKLFSTPYSSAYNGSIMTNIGGVQSESPSGESIKITNTTNLDDNYKTIGKHVVYLASPSGGTWNNNDNQSKKTCLRAFHERSNIYKDTACVEMTLAGEIKEGNTTYYYYRCEIPEGYNKIRFEKRADASKFVSGDLKSITLKYEIPLNSINCYKLNNYVNNEFTGAWESAPGFKGDYRLTYIKKVGIAYPSDIVRSGTSSQIVSLHIDPTIKDNDAYPKLELQKYDGTQWQVQETKLVKDISTITTDTYEQGRGVWNFEVKQNGSTMAVDYEKAERYTGNYYIRTNNAEGGWRNYTLSTNKMTYSSYAKAHSGYTHFYCRWVGIEWINQAKGESSKLPGKNNNVKFIVANDYGAVISNELAEDSHTGTGGILPENANVRWTWDERTNEVKRAYILGSDKDHLMLTYEPPSNDTTITKKLADKENWIYEIDLQDVRQGSVLNTLSATYPSKATTITFVEGGITKTEDITPETQTFISDKPMITSDYGTSHKVRVMYDFKTNQTSVMLIPDNNKADIGIDVLIERENQGDATQVTSPINAASLEGYTVYAAMTFKKEHIMSETATEWERLYYWVSFPFNVRISDVFGFGEYGKQWVIQYYNGALRAKNGYQSEDQTFWRYINPKDTVYNPNKALEDANGNPCNGVMVANRGYILALAKSIAQQGIFQNNNDHVRLYFPSMEKIQRIDGNMQNVTAILKPYTCTISGREEYDSHWHVIGAPSYANKNVAVTQNDLFFYYKYDAKTNTYEVQETNSVEFKSMHSYMVQYAGNINWSANTTFVPQQIAASRNADYEPQLCHLGLLLMQDGKTLDQTFIRMQEDNATADYDMNLDLTKIINSGANIYSLAGDKQIELAGNVLPTDDTTIPLGVLIRQTGDYTFSMPAGTDGAVVELIDYETNTRTNLLLSDYTVNIPTGTHTNRFALRVEQSKTATGIESPADNAAGVNKYIINGQLIIVRDGATYNTIGQQL